MAGSDEDAIAAFRRDAKTGRLTLSHALKDAEHPECGLEGLATGSGAAEKPAASALPLT